MSAVRLTLRQIRSSLSRGYGVEQSIFARETNSFRQNAVTIEGSTERRTFHVLIKDQIIWRWNDLVVY